MTFKYTNLACGGRETKKWRQLGSLVDARFDATSVLTCIIYNAHIIQYVMILEQQGDGVQD